MAGIQKRRENERRKRSLKRLIGFLALLILILGTTVLIALSPTFNIGTITVNGNSRYEAEEIINVSCIEEGQNGFAALGPGIEQILSLRYAEAENRIKESLPYIKNAVVKYIIPDTIRISLMERKPFCYIQYFGTYILIDREGFVLETEQTPKGLPIIKGCNIKGMEIGHALQPDDSENFERVASLIEAIQESDMEADPDLLKTADYFELSGREIHFLLDSRIMVKIDDRNDTLYTVELLREIIIKNIPEDEKGILDFTQGKNPTFMPGG